MKALLVEYLVGMVVGFVVICLFFNWGYRTGDRAVQAQWDAQKLADATESVRLAREASAEQLLQFRNTERITDEQARLDAQRTNRVNALSAESRSLRDTLDALNQRDLPAAPSDASVAARLGEARTVRELFGRCTAEVEELARGAEQLRDQVMGLQDYALRVCRSAPAPPAVPLPTQDANLKPKKD